MTDRSEALRAFYARYVCLHGGVRDARIEAAFATVKREDFLGPPPWLLPAGGDDTYFATPDGDVAFIYQNILVALDAKRGINNGEPSLHARCLDALAIRAGETILHVGAGTGYYTAILAELTGPTGRIHAYEVDPELASRAKAALAHLHHAGVRPESGSAENLPKADAIYVNAGITQPDWAWLDALKPAGRLLFPLQPERGFGGMLLVTKPAQGGLSWPARFVCRAGFIPMQGRQDDETGRRLAAAFPRNDWRDVRSLVLDGKPNGTEWVAGADWWLSKTASQ